MMGRAHIVISTGVSLSVLGLAGVPVTLPAAAVAAVSSLLPDIDEPNSILVRTVIPTWLLRILQLVLVGAALLVYAYGEAYAPWHLALAGLIGIVSFLPGRTMRHVVMFMIGLGVLEFGDDFAPWNTIAACVLILSSLVTHRGLTHSLYAAAGWPALLYYGSSGDPGGLSVWLAGGLSYALHLAADMLTNRGIKPLPPLRFRLRIPVMSTGTRQGGLVENVCIALTFVMVWYVFIASR